MEDIDNCHSQLVLVETGVLGNVKGTYAEKAIADVKHRIAYQANNLKELAERL